MSLIKKQLIIVGSNPSSASPDCSPFHPTTKSRQFIDKLFKHSNYELTYVNLVDYKTDDNKPLSNKVIKLELVNIKQKFHGIFDTKIITLGKTASYGLELAGIEHFALPHPSGLCRFWNDRVASEAKIKEMLEWIES
jgi:hypothetical protein